MSGGWQTKFTLAAPTRVMLYLRGNLTQSPNYETDEKSELLVSLDGVLKAAPPSDYLAQVVGDGNTGSASHHGLEALFAQSRHAGRRARTPW